MKYILCLCIVVMACVTGSWAAQNCPNGQPLFTKVYYPQGDIKRKIWYANGKYHFDIQLQALVTMNCDRSPCVEHCQGALALYSGEPIIHLFSLQGEQTPKDPWCDDGDQRTITVSGVGTQYREPVSIYFWVDGLRLL